MFEAELNGRKQTWFTQATWLLNITDVAGWELLAVFDQL